MSLLVTKPGILTTVQDLGRTGHRSLGINPGGVMDGTASRLVNTLLGNDEGEAVLELHFPAGEFMFEMPCSFAVGGADLAPALNGRPVGNWSTHSAEQGDTLTFAAPLSGMRAYLAVAGGLAIDEWLGSRSTNLAAAAGGFRGRKLAAGDRVGFAAPSTVPPTAAGPSLVPRYNRFPTVRIVPGPEFDLLTAVSELDLLSAAFTVTADSDRMGYRLDGPAIFLIDETELVSSAVTFGTVQLLPDGRLIVLMADHQTSGGYPRLGNVIESDLPLLAQLGRGDGISFHAVSVEDAELSLLAFERDLCFLRMGVRLKN